MAQRTYKAQASDRGSQRSVAGGVEPTADMAEEYQLSLTLPQVQALIRALEQCGVDSGSPRIELEHFRSAQVVTAAKSAYEVLKAKKRRIDRLK